MKHWRELNASDLASAYMYATGHNGGKGRVLVAMKRLLEEYEYTATQILEAIVRYKDEPRGLWIGEFGDPEFMAEYALEPLDAEASLLETNGCPPPDALFEYANNKGDQGIPDIRMARRADEAQKKLEDWVNANLERSTVNSGGVVDSIVATQGRSVGNRAQRRNAG